VIDFEPGCRKGGTLCELHRREMRDSYARRYFAPVGPGLILRGLTLRPATAAATRLFICGCQRTVGAEAVTSADSSGASNPHLDAPNMGRDLMLLREFGRSYDCHNSKLIDA
jgi:hypothetical protein